MEAQPRVGEEQTGDRGTQRSSVDVSIIMPVYNAFSWLDQCLQGIYQQDFSGSMELSVFDDASTDDSMAVLEAWRDRLEARGVAVVVSGHKSAQPMGVGHSKNQAVAQSSGEFLCFQDSDDIMLPQRVRLQFESCRLHPNSLIGSRICRLPQGSTERYTRWINSLTPDQLQTQAFTSHGPTVVMPTWFCSQKLFQKVGPFNEGGKGVPEDLLFFYQHLRQGGSLVRVNECLLVYRYHEEAATHSVTEETMWKLRLDFLQERVLSQWEHFTIWNAGKQGRKLFRSLSPSTQRKLYPPVRAVVAKAGLKVRAFCDVDVKKIKRGFYTYEESQERPKPRVPVLDFREACGPFLICVKLDMTGGELEENLSSLHLKEGIDYYHFS